MTEKSKAGAGSGAGRITSRRDELEWCERFLAELGRGIPSDERVMVGYAAEATVQTDENGKKQNAGWWPTPYAAGKFIDQNKNAYVCISSSIKTPNPKTGDMRYWRGTASFGHGLALLVDDVGSGRGSKGGLSVRALSDVLQPSAVVETSPGNYQCWYFLDEPCANMALFKGMLVGFVQRVLLDRGGDVTIQDVSRYGRMPCGINNKRLSDGRLKYDEGFRVRLRLFKPTVRYSIDQICAAFGYDAVDFMPRSRVAEDDGERYGAVDHFWLGRAVEICSAAAMGEGGAGVVTQNMSGKYRIMCPWGHEHTNGDPFGAYFRGPIPGEDVPFVFGCAHDTCRRDAKRGWGDFVDEMVMPEIYARMDDINRQFLSIKLNFKK